MLLIKYSCKFLKCNFESEDKIMRTTENIILFLTGVFNELHRWNTVDKLAYACEVKSYFSSI